MNWQLKELDALDTFIAIYSKGDNFYYFLFVSQYIRSLLKGPTVKGKNLLPVGANSFLLE